MTYPHHPRFGSNYRGLTNRLDLLLECYSYLPVRGARRRPPRPGSSRRSAGSARARRRRARRSSRRASAPPRSRRRPLPPRAPSPSRSRSLTRTPRTLDGAPTTLSLPHFARFVGTTVIDRPTAYLVPPSTRRAPRAPRARASIRLERRVRRSRSRASSRSASRGRPRDPRGGAASASSVVVEARPGAPPEGRYRVARISRSARSRSTCASPRATTARWRTGFSRCRPWGLITRWCGSGDRGEDSGGRIRAGAMGRQGAQASPHSAQARFGARADTSPLPPPSPSPGRGSRLGRGARRPPDEPPPLRRLALEWRGLPSGLPIALGHSDLGHRLRHGPHLCCRIDAANVSGPPKPPDVVGSRDSKGESSQTQGRQRAQSQGPCKS